MGAGLAVEGGRRHRRCREGRGRPHDRHSLQRDRGASRATPVAREVHRRRRGSIPSRTSTWSHRGFGVEGDPEIENRGHPTVSDGEVLDGFDAELGAAGGGVKQPKPEVDGAGDHRSGVGQHALVGDAGAEWCGQRREWMRRLWPERRRRVSLSFISASVTDRCWGRKSSSRPRPRHRSPLLRLQPPRPRRSGLRRCQWRRRSPRLQRFRRPQCASARSAKARLRPLST